MFPTLSSVSCPEVALRNTASKDVGFTVAFVVPSELSVHVELPVKFPPAITTYLFTAHAGLTHRQKRRVRRRFFICFGSKIAIPRCWFLPLLM